MKVLSAVLFSLLLAPVSAFATSATMSELWAWFVARDYGDGPSYGAWYGIALIFSVLIGPQLASVTTEKPDANTHPAVHVLGRVIGIVVMCLVVLGVAWLVGSVTHWKA